MFGMSQTRIAWLAVPLILGLVAATAAPASERTVSGVSEWEPDRELAVREADRFAKAAVHAWLEQTLDAALSQRQLDRWLDHPEVARREVVERRERAYGELSRATVSYRIESATWERWRIENARQAASQRNFRLARAALTLLVAFATACGTRLWDRRTHGYDRCRIGLASLLFLLTASATIWLV
jgi:hypothetical protein